MPGPTPRWIRDAAVAQVRVHGWTRVDVALDLGCSPTSVQHWVQEAIREEQEAAQRGPTPEEIERTGMSRRLAALEAENAVWRQAAGGALARVQGNLGAGYAWAASDRMPPSPLSPTGFPLDALPRQLDGEAQA